MEKFELELPIKMVVKGALSSLQDLSSSQEVDDLVTAPLPRSNSMEKVNFSLDLQESPWPSWNHSNGTMVWPGDLGFNEELPLYLRVTALVFLFVIFAVGTIGNTMVIIVINCSRDMRTSTNIFLVNLSVADLLVLLICTPTCIMEVYYDPEIWLLGEAMCKFVPLLEVIVAHTSVLTILAISFERYYAICCPLRANYVCTKTRAVSICLTAWFAACLITSPMYWMINFKEELNEKPSCYVVAGELWPDIYTISTIILFFLLPLIILIITYGLIARNLTADSCRLTQNYTRQNHRARQQVVLMLGTVVFTFFLCLLPFRVLTIYVVLVEQTTLVNNTEIYYNLLYFCRIMLYINSALNPILYNIMSSKFRNGFLTLCYRKKRRISRFHRQGTFHTMTTTSSASTASNVSTHFIHPASIACTNERRRLGLGLYGQCCKCQCHDYVTHVLGDPTASLSNGHATTNCTKNKNNRRNNNFSNTSNPGCYAHWYCRKCRENPKWDNKYLHPSSSTANAVIVSKDGLSNYSSYGKCKMVVCAGRASGGGGNNVSEKCFGFNCQFCRRRGLQESRRTSALEKNGGKKKMTIKMALKNNYYSCSFASFSNTNTMETIL